MSVTFLSWVTRHTSIEALAYIGVGDRTGDLVSGGHGTASRHGDYYRGSSELDFGHCSRNQIAGKIAADEGFVEGE
jgi:hypothetical protein